MKAGEKWWLSGRSGRVIYNLSDKHVCLLLPCCYVNWRISATENPPENNRLYNVMPPFSNYSAITSPGVWMLVMCLGRGSPWNLPADPGRQSSPCAKLHWSMRHLHTFRIRHALEGRRGSWSYKSRPQKRGKQCRVFARHWKEKTSLETTCTNVIKNHNWFYLKWCIDAIMICNVSNTAVYSINIARYNHIDTHYIRI